MTEIMCPFCPLIAIKPAYYLPVGDDFFGQPAMIGNIPSCAACATIAEFEGNQEDLIEDVFHLLQLKGNESLNNIQAWAQAMLAFPNLTFCVLDTTGIEDDADVLRVLTINRDGFIGEHEYVRSLRHPQTPNTEYTKITQTMMDNSPQLSLVWPEICNALTGKFVLAYNLNFVRRRLDENAEHYNLAPLYVVGMDLQQAATLYFRRLTGYTGVQLKLQDACARIGHRLPERPDAHDRAKGQLALLRAMSEGITSKPSPPAPAQEGSDDDLPQDMLDHPF